MDINMKETFDHVEYENDEAETPRYESMDSIVDRKYYNHEESNAIKTDSDDGKPTEFYLEPIHPGDYRVNCVRTPIRHVRSCESSDNSENAFKQRDIVYSHTSNSMKCFLCFVIICFLVVIAAFISTILVLKSLRDQEVASLEHRLEDLETKLKNTTSDWDRLQHNVDDLQVSMARSQTALIDRIDKIDTIQTTTTTTPVPSVPNTQRVHTAFRATLSGPLVPESAGKIVFGNATLNEGGAYNTTSGVFTCQKDGYYVFSFSIVSYNGYFSAQLEVNDVWRQFAIADSTTGQHGSSTAVTVTKLKAGDEVWIGVEIKGAGSTLHEYESFFSGWNL